MTITYTQESIILSRERERSAFRMARVSDNTFGAATFSLVTLSSLSFLLLFLLDYSQRR